MQVATKEMAALAGGPEATRSLLHSFAVNPGEGDGVTATLVSGGGRALKTRDRSNVDELDLGGKPWQFKGTEDYIFVTNA
ncbi:hypothetical protein PMI41_03564 [Phyllobacterium sp. YR531]|nr:hypothetical protein PMI41_03564 [Phyllobacterium sp. YR531]